MKKYLISLLAVLTLSGCAYAFAPKDAWTDVRDNTHFTALEGFGSAYYYSAKSGSDSSSQAGVSDRFLTYRDVLTANFGWSNALNGHETGSIVGGPGLLIDPLLAKMFPLISDIVKSIPSASVQNLLNAHFFNLYGGWKTSNGAFDYGVATGLELKF